MEPGPKSILVITGPTASGKTEAALELARNNRSIEIVNADASLLYRGFDIGTAKPSQEIRNEIPHHLIDLLEPDEQCSAADYSNHARGVITEILRRGNMPIVVGGTGLYIEALFKGLPDFGIEEEALRAARMRASEEIASRGFEAMHEALREIDPELYRQILREHNPLRLERAWSHYYATGEALGIARMTKPDRFEFPPEFRVLNIPREELWQRIESRVDRMLDEGWLMEAESLKQHGVSRETPGMRAIGYRELFEVVVGAMSLEQARERIIFRTRQYAKRQVTWLRSRLPRLTN